MRLGVGKLRTVLGDGRRAAGSSIGSRRLALPCGIGGALLCWVISAASPAFGEFQCYEVKPAAFDPVPLTVRDRFGTLAYAARFPHRLCAPTGDDPGRDRYVMGYTVDADRDRIPGLPLVTRFGSVTVDLIRPDLLMVPTAIDAEGPPLGSPTGNVRQCYHVDVSSESPDFEPIDGVEVTDGLETVVVDLVEPSRLCVPANVNGDGEPAPGNDLLCYTTRSADSFGDERLFTQNRFGPDEARLIDRRELCVPVDERPETTTTSSSTTTTSSSSSSSTSSTTTSSTTPVTVVTSTTTTTTTSTTSTSSGPTTTIATTTTVVTTTSTTVPGTCGDGKLDAGEECDDGNRTAGDCCSPTCRLEPDGASCGDDDVCNGDERCRAGRCETAPACRSNIVLAAITNFRGNTVSLVDPTSGLLQGSIAGGGGPWGVAFDPRGTEIWITNRTGKSISVIDVAARSLAASIPVGRTPLGIAFDATGGRAYVASYGGDRIDVIDTASRATVAHFAVDRGPSGVAFDASSNALLVTCYAADTLLVLDAGTGGVRARLSVGRKPTQLALDAQRRRLYVSSFGAGSVTVIDVDRHAVLATMKVGRKPFGVAVDPGRGRAYVTNAGQDTLTVIDTTTNAVVGRRQVAAGPLGVGVDPDGRILVTSGTAGVLSFLEPSGAGTSSLVVGALPVAFGSFVGTVGTRCPEAPPCDAAGPAIAGPDALVALLDAASEILRQAGAATVPDAALAGELVNGVARSRQDVAGDDGSALRRDLRGMQRALRRGMARGGIEGATGSQLLDLVQRARALVLREHSEAGIQQAFGSP